MRNLIHIIIADDHELFIDGLKLLIQSEPDLIIDEIAYDGRELMDVLRAMRPDIILLDINMPKINGLEASVLIKNHYAGIKIIILSTYDEDHLIDKAKVLGVNGYLLKNSNKEELLQTIRLVHAGQACFPYRSSKVGNDFNENDSFLKQFNLTKRELEIAQLIKMNGTNLQIAGKLSLSIYTVETHRKNIMQKLGLKSPVSLMKFLIENNI